MFLINSQIPFLTYSSSTLEPIFLPKLLIYFAEFPYNLYLSTFYAIAYHLGYLLRFRYDLFFTHIQLFLFSSEQLNHKSHLGF